MFRNWSRRFPGRIRRSLGSRYRAHLQFQQLDDRCNPSTSYIAINLISDLPGVAQITDPTLQNAWGISLSPTAGAFWISSNGQNLSELYGGDVNGSAISQPFKVAIPGGAPTGQVFNGTGSLTDFLVTDGTNTKPAAFIFASEDGRITGWNPTVGGAAPSKTAENGFVATDGAIYKGLALGQVGGANFLFATDFHNGKIDVVDGQFHQVQLGANGFETFTDPNIPQGYAPFGIANIGGKLYVSFAKQDADAHDDVRGKGNGFIDVFETNGHFDGRLVSRGDLNSPWGMVQAPAGFGDFAGDLLVGNFGDGRIHAFNSTTGKELGTLGSSQGRPLVIEGLWGLAFGNGHTAGDANSLYFASGPDGEAHGLVGKITANAAGTNPVSATLNGSDLVITGSRDDDRVFVSLNHPSMMNMNRDDSHITVRASGQIIGQFDVGSVGTIHFNGFAGDDTFVVDPGISAEVIADGGAGNDVLFGGSGNNILLGGSGNDLIVGGGNRDILIAGDGLDQLFGMGNDDILIGGSTAFDSDQASLQKIMDVWSSNASFNDRVAAIRAGTNGVPKLDATTVTDDGSRDFLTGGRGLDWYFSASPDRIIGKTSTEPVN
jgi:uncharacterized protein (TIGR03118 family)